MLPVVFVSFFGVVWVGQYYYRLKKPGHWLKDWETWTDEKKAKLARHKGAGFVVSMIVSLFLVQPSLAKTTFSVYDCVELDQGSSWLQMSMDIDCTTMTYFTWTGFVGSAALLLYVLGIPAFAYFILRKNQHRLHEPKKRAMFGSSGTPGVMYNGLYCLS